MPVGAEWLKDSAGQFGTRAHEAEMWGRHNGWHQVSLAVSATQLSASGSTAKVGGGIVHVVRRLTQAERDEFNVPEPYDIRGTEEEAIRIATVIKEAPYLLPKLARLYA